MRNISNKVFEGWRENHLSHVIEIKKKKRMNVEKLYDYKRKYVVKNDEILKEKQKP